MAQKPTGKLKAFVNVAKKNTRVIGSVERHVLSKPPEQGRRTDVLHPSEMSSPDWCYRASYFQLLGHSVKGKKAPSFRLMSVFDEGHMIHAKWQRWFQEMGVLYGKWYCHDCGEMFWGGSDCHEGPLEYREVPLFYEPLRIFGHSDGWIKGLGDDLMLEIKSVGLGTFRWEAPELIREHDGDFEKMWKDLKGPFMKHITQVQIYMKLAELLELPDFPQEAVMIYESKASQEIKEFVIHKSDFDVAHLFQAAADICDAVDSKTPLPCNISTDGCSKCKGYENV